jgi:hypothetical protein
MVEHILYRILHWLSIILGNVCHYITRAQRIHFTATHTHTQTNTHTANVMVLHNPVPATMW